MSVQLIVYPQGYNGVYDATTNPATDFIVNGSNFVGLDNAPAISDFSIFNVLFYNLLLFQTVGIVIVIL
tara:strand:- start:341 stop:547 length:207 start_codon:yes stop_codon:yes gene_type:complete